MPEALDQELREALADLDEYLSDRIAPLLFADSFSILLHGASSLVAKGIARWASAQFQAHGTRLPLSDLLFHAFKKLLQMGELELVSNESLVSYLTELRELVVDACPITEKEALRANLERIEVARMERARPVDLLFRHQEREVLPERASAASAGPTPLHADTARSAVLTEEEVHRFRQFTSLLERLEAQPHVLHRTTAGDAGREGLTSQVLAMAVENAQSERELRQHIDRLRQSGIGEVRLDQVIGILSRELPNWMVTTEDEKLGHQSPLANALGRLVMLADDPGEGIERLQEMLRSAVEQFNAGSVARAVTLFQLAERIITERKVDAAMGNVARVSAQRSLDEERLRELASEPRHHSLLRKILKFFPAFRAECLLETLEKEEDRQRRRLLLSLLEVRGDVIRPAILERLEASFADGNPEGWHFQRNLVYLLRRLPPAAKGPDETEVACVVRLSELDRPLPVVREAIAYLGQVADERAEQALVKRLGHIESFLAGPEPPFHGAEELRRLLNLLVPKLAHFGTSKAREAAVEHGLKTDPQLGNTAARLVALSGIDLSDDPDLVRKLVAALQRSMPVKVLGFSLPNRDAEKLKNIVDALSATPLPSVRETLTNLARRFPGSDFGKAAAEALERFEIPSDAQPREQAPPAGHLEGDLEVFGLPNLLQSLEQSAVSGFLALNDKSGSPVAHLGFRSGALVECRTGMLQGKDAFYQLLENPVSVTFRFSAQRSEAAPEEGEQGDAFRIMPLIMEGIRRYDELQRVRALVPDETKLKPTGVGATSPSEEQDDAFIQEVWTRIGTGCTARECEEDIATDAYRIRSLLAFWVERGSLKFA